MAKSKISWTPAEEKGLASIIEHKKVFLQRCAKELDTNLTITASTVGWQAILTMKYLLQNPNRLMLCLTIGRVLHTTVFPYHHSWPGGTSQSAADFIDKLATRFEAVIQKKYAKYKTLKKLEAPTETLKIKELLKRGFISYEDIDYLEAGKWVIWHRILRLIHPTDYETKEEAQAFYEKFGIKGTTINYISHEQRI